MRRFRPTDPESIPLLHSIELTDISPEMVREKAHDINQNVRIGLEIGSEVHQSEKLHHRRVRRLHRFSSSQGVLGPRLLQLLDHAEARANDLTYFYCHPNGNGKPNGDVMHYVLENHLHDERDQFHPVGECTYVQPESFETVGLPIFLLQGTRFRPSLDLILEDLSDDSTFVEQLREKMGLNGDPTAIAIVEPGSSPANPSVLVLRGGKPLSEAVQFTLENFHSASLTVASDAVQDDMTERADADRDGLLEISDEETAGVVYETRGFLEALGILTGELDERLEVIEKRVAEIMHFVNSADKHLDLTKKDWGEFVAGMLDLEATLAQDQYDWLVTFRIEEGERERALKATDYRALKLIEWCQKRYDALEMLRAALEEKCNRIDAICNMIDAMVQESDPSSGFTINRVKTASAAAEAKLRDWQARLDEREIAFGREFREVHDESMRLGQRQADLEARQDEMKRMESKNNEVSGELDRLEEELGEEEDALTVERTHLRKRKAGLDQRSERLRRERDEFEREEDRLPPSRESRAKDARADGDETADGKPGILGRILGKGKKKKKPDSDE